MNGNTRLIAADLNRPTTVGGRYSTSGELEELSSSKCGGRRGEEDPASAKDDSERGEGLDIVEASGVVGIRCTHVQLVGRD
jgi:hypothetical protein